MEASYSKAAIGEGCKKCEKWYNAEKEDLTWLHDLNTNFKCPCRVKGAINLSPVDNPSNQLWESDWACKAGKLPLCEKFHNGAYGCIRSKETSRFGARQQCCYSKSGNLIRPGHPGAGTPDRYRKFSKHQEFDVKPYYWCCEDCESKKHCDYYINKARKGDASHCSKASLSEGCKKCEKWYNAEKEDLNWLHDLNTNFKCPCKVEGAINLSPVDNPSNQLWESDWACKAGKLPLCKKFHNGAYGCIRSKKTSHFDARQQCCYYRSGNLIRPGLRGAGTPDRSVAYSQHQKLDVEPYNWCCRNCESQKYCNYYINEVRKGDASHCP